MFIDRENKRETSISLQANPSWILKKENTWHLQNELASTLRSECFRVGGGCVCVCLLFQIRGVRKPQFTAVTQKHIQSESTVPVINTPSNLSTIATAEC